MKKWEMKQIQGVIPALVTPFKEDESVDEEKTRNLVEYLLDIGVDGFYLTGSTGEGFLMDETERKKVVEVVIDQVKDRVPVIVHVGAISTKISVELAKHAYEAGAAAVSSVPPFYYKFSFDEIYNYYKDISDATPLPLIIYSIPATTGVDMGIDAIVKLAEIDNVKGIKYTSMNHFEMQRIKERLSGNFAVYSGADEMALSGMLMGADGIIGSSYNCIPEVFIQMLSAIEEGDINVAKEHQIIANDIIEIFARYTYHVSLKQAMKWLGVDCGRNRRPFKSFTTEEKEALRKDLLNLKQSKNPLNIKLLETLS
ncbi:MAG: N-acetylneuraminate lyase [Caldicoprobacterales bacterium]